MIKYSKKMKAAYFENLKSVSMSIEDMISMLQTLPKNSMILVQEGHGSEVDEYNREPRLIKINDNYWSL